MTYEIQTGVNLIIMLGISGLIFGFGFTLGYLVRGTEK